LHPRKENIRTKMAFFMWSSYLQTYAGRQTVVEFSNWRNKTRIVRFSTQLEKCPFRDFGLTHPP